MEYSILWETPEDAENDVTSAFTFTHDNENKRLRLRYFSDNHNSQWYYEIRFSMTLCYRYETDQMKNLIPEAHEKLIEIKNSPWIEELRKAESEVLDFWKVKHYAVFIENEGLFEFIAKDYKIYEGDPREEEDE